MPNSIQHTLATAAARLLLPFQQLDDPKRISAFMKELGYDFIGVGFSFAEDTIKAFNTIQTALGDLSDGDNEAAIAKLIEAIPSVVSALKESDDGSDLQNLATLLEPPLSAEELKSFIQNFPRRTLDYLLCNYLQRYHPKPFALLHLAGLIKHDLGYWEMAWGDLPKMLYQPQEVLNKAYHWSDSEPFDSKELFTRLEVLMRAFLWPGGLYPKAESGDEKELRIPIYQGGVWSDDENNSYQEIDINISALPEEEDKGLLIYPYFFNKVKLDEDLSA
jgi:hypothetical protein